MKVLVAVVLLSVVATAVMATPDDDYFFYRRPARPVVHVLKPARPTRYVVRQFSVPFSPSFSPYHFFDDDHFDRKKRSAEPEPVAEASNSRKKRDADFDDDFPWYSVGHVAPRIYSRPRVYYRPAPFVPFGFGRGFFDDK
ncbi:uncharacterized protein LOC123508691 [Portunus trituberculatus]|uniref:uncharacterized protein LOC123508691 n=1 Tax=Portunus trituberculatus TaxID=210409 RepID=UPI001E1CD08A|nr:uncharacterized protein LOC123508691 [Portunus trituberculatus]